MLDSIMMGDLNNSDFDKFIKNFVLNDGRIINAKDVDFVMFLKDSNISIANIFDVNRFLFLQHLDKEHYVDMSNMLYMTSHIYKYRCKYGDTFDQAFERYQRNLKTAKK